MFVLASCQKGIVQPEVDTPVVEGGYETVTFNVAAPSQAQTKTTYGETVTFTPELMVAVYLKNQTAEKIETKYLQDVNAEITRKSNTEWTVTVNLVKNFSYDIVFWAQRDDAPYAIDWAKGTITADYTVPANDVTRDAFYFLCKNYSFNDHKNDSAPYQVTLTRPFAQINLGASDYSALVELYKFVGKTGSDLKTRIKTATASVPSVLNVLSGAADTQKEVEFTLAYTTPADGSYNLVDPANDIKVTGTDGTGAEVTKSYKLVGTNYIFANVHKPENPTVDFTLTFDYNGQSFDLNVPNVPYARNYQTNILGNFFTSDSKFNVVIVPKFNTPDQYVDENGNKIEPEEPAVPEEPVVPEPDEPVVPEEVTANVVMKDLGFDNGTAVEDVKMDDNVTLSFAKGSASNAPAYYTSGEAVRLYQNGATLTVNANGKTIKSIKITFAENQYYIAADSGEFTAEGTERTWTGSAESVKFTTTGTDKNHRAYVSAVEVTYE